MRAARIEVPASSANLGPGFDTLGLALDIVDVVRVLLDDEQREPDWSELDATAGHDHLIRHAYQAWGKHIAQALPAATFEVNHRIPRGRGLGSSAAAAVAGLAAGAFATGEKSPTDSIMRLAAAIEGHADNVAAATWGGFTCAFRDNDEVRTLPVANHLYMGVALFIPERPLGTRHSRGALPGTVPHGDAVFNVGRVAYLTTALTWGRWELIGPAMTDRLHQPYRAELLPALQPVIDSAVAAGAYGAALSGGGPSVIALTPTEASEHVAAAMESCARSHHWPGHSMVTRVRHKGVTIAEEKSPAPSPEES